MYNPKILNYVIYEKMCLYGFMFKVNAIEVNDDDNINADDDDNGGDDDDNDNIVM